MCRKYVLLALILAAAFLSTISSVEAVSITDGRYGKWDKSDVNTADRAAWNATQATVVVTDANGNTTSYYAATDTARGTALLAALANMDGDGTEKVELTASGYDCGSSQVRFPAGVYNLNGAHIWTDCNGTGNNPFRNTGTPVTFNNGWLDMPLDASGIFQYGYSSYVPNAIITFNHMKITGDSDCLFSEPNGINSYHYLNSCTLDTEYDAITGSGGAYILRDCNVTGVRDGVGYSSNIIRLLTGNAITIKAYNSRFYVNNNANTATVRSYIASDINVASLFYNCFFDYITTAPLTNDTYGHSIYVSSDEGPNVIDCYGSGPGGSIITGSKKINTREFLLGSADVNMTAGAATTTLFTSARDSNVMISKVLVANPTASLADGTVYTFSHGLPATDLSSMTAFTDFMIITPNGATKYTLVPEKTAFTITPTTGSTATAFAKVSVYGYVKN